jgi:hypothetical protein
MENIKDKPTHYFAFDRISSYLENTMNKTTKLPLLCTCVDFGSCILTLQSLVMLICPSYLNNL